MLSMTLRLKYLTLWFAKYFSVYTKHIIAMCAKDFSPTQEGVVWEIKLAYMNISKEYGETAYIKFCNYCYNW